MGGTKAGVPNPGTSRQTKAVREEARRLIGLVTMSITRTSACALRVKRMSTRQLLESRGWKYSLISPECHACGLQFHPLPKKPHRQSSGQDTHRDEGGYARGAPSGPIRRNPGIRRFGRRVVEPRLRTLRSMLRSARSRISNNWTEIPAIGNGSGRPTIIDDGHSDFPLPLTQAP